MRKDIYERIKVLKMDNIEPNFAKMLIRLTVKGYIIIIKQQLPTFSTEKNYIKLLTITYRIHHHFLIINGMYTRIFN